MQKCLLPLLILALCAAVGSGYAQTRKKSRVPQPRATATRTARLQCFRTLPERVLSRALQALSGREPAKSGPDLDIRGEIVNFVWSDFFGSHKFF